MYPVLFTHKTTPHAHFDVLTFAGAKWDSLKSMLFESAVEICVQKQINSSSFPHFSITHRWYMYRWYRLKWIWECKCNSYEIAHGNFKSDRSKFRIHLQRPFLINDHFISSGLSLDRRIAEFLVVTYPRVQISEQSTTHDTGNHSIWEKWICLYVFFWWFRKSTDWAICPQIMHK